MVNILEMTTLGICELYFESWSFSALTCSKLIFKFYFLADLFMFFYCICL
jgi:hypothetical protein